MSIPERDWRLLRSLSRTALERYCARVLDESAHVLERNRTSHERYLQLFALLNERNESLASAFDDLRRSTAIQRLAAMIILGVVTDADLSELSATTRDSAKTLAEISRPRGRRRRAP